MSSSSRAAPGARRRVGRSAPLAPQRAELKVRETYPESSPPPSRRPSSRLRVAKDVAWASVHHLLRWRVGSRWKRRRLTLLPVAVRERGHASRSVLRSSWVLAVPLCSLMGLTLWGAWCLCVWGRRRRGWRVSSLHAARVPSWLGISNSDPSQLQSTPPSEPAYLTPLPFFLYTNPSLPLANMVLCFCCRRRPPSGPTC